MANWTATLAADLTLYITPSCNVGIWHTHPLGPPGHTLSGPAKETCESLNH
ncbi:MAG TPA: hypothetical protein VGZ25_06045 [Gemmataceae bacterium]|nr:hypothetical protein [Gemmataceae bacterium]